MTVTSPLPSTSRRSRKRLAAVLAIGLVAVGAGFAYRHFWYTWPVGEGPAGPIVPRERFDRLWTDRSVLLVGLGDSVTAGYGAGPGLGFFNRLVNNPRDEFPEMQGLCLSKVLPRMEVLNLALAGANSMECLDRQVPRLEPQDEETFGIIVMTVGGNDLIHDYGRSPPREGAMYGATLEQARPWIDKFEARLQSILDRIEEKFPGDCAIFIANVYDPTDGEGDCERVLPRWPDALAIVAAYNDVVARTADARKNVYLVDMRGAFLGHGIHCRQFWKPYYHADDPHYWYGENLEDPNDRGYDALRRLFLIEMARVLPATLEDGD